MGNRCQEERNPPGLEGLHNDWLVLKRKIKSGITAVFSFFFWGVGGCNKAQSLSTFTGYCVCFLDAVWMLGIFGLKLTRRCLRTGVGRTKRGFVINWRGARVFFLSLWESEASTQVGVRGKSWNNFGFKRGGKGLLLSPVT